MEVRIVNAVILVRQMYRKVGDHAPGDELLRYKLPRQGDVLFQRKLGL